MGESCCVLYGDEGVGERGWEKGFEGLLIIDRSQQSVSCIHVWRDWSEWIHAGEVDMKRVYGGSWSLRERGPKKEKRKRKVMMREEKEQKRKRQEMIRVGKRKTKKMNRELKAKCKEEEEDAACLVVKKIRTEYGVQAILGEFRRPGSLMSSWNSLSEVEHASSAELKCT